MMQALRSYTHSAREISYQRSKKDPEYTFYESEGVTVTAYKVKPAVFDLVLSMGIAGYLGLLYLFLMRAGWFYRVLTSALTSAASGSSSPSPRGTPAKTASNGNGHTNGKLKAH